MTIIKRKEIEANTECYNVVLDLHGAGSVTFVADLPANAIVAGVVVKGKHLEDHRINVEFGNMIRTIYPKDEMFEGHRVAAIYIDESLAGELYNEAVAHLIESFIVEYVETAVQDI